MKTKGKSKRHIGFFKAGLCLVLAAITALAGILPANAAKKEDHFNISVTYGFEGKIEYGCYIPVNITIENTGDNFEGLVQLIIPQMNGYETESVMYEKDLSIVAGTTKTVSLTIHATRSLSAMKIRIVTPKEKVISEKVINVTGLSSINSVNIGVLTDDYSALSYLSGKQLYISQYSTNIKSLIRELTAETFPEDYKALDMMDLILVTNFSTDKLSAAQLDALNSWVANGGILLIGTGSTENKVLSGLKNIPACEFLKNAEITYETYKTLYGLSVCDSNLIKQTDLSGNFDNTYTNSWIYNEYTYLPAETQNELKTRFESFLEENALLLNDSSATDFDFLMLTFFEKEEDYLRKTFSLPLLGYTPLDSDWTSGAKDKLYYYMWEILTVLYQQIQNEKKNPGVSVMPEYSPVNASVANISVPGSTAIWGEDLSNDIRYSLVKRFSYGQGSVAVAGIDFTQNPLISFEGKSDFACVLIKTLLGSTFESELVNYINYYGSGYNYYNSNTEAGFQNLVSTMESASVPPVLLYTLLLILYLVSIFVTYNKLKKKGKSILFWLTQLVSAIAFSLLILLMSLTTRIHSPQLRVSAVKEHTESGTVVSDVSTLIMPKKKTYKISFDNAKNTERTPFYSGYYYTNNSASLDSYYIGFNRKTQSTDIKINNSAPLNSESFLSRYTDSEDTGSFKIENIGKFECRITNNTGKDLTKAFVIFNFEFYPLDNFANGETREISSLSISYSSPTNYNNYQYYGYGYNVSPIYTYFMGTSSLSFKELFIGSNNNKYIERRIPLAFYGYVADYVFSGLDEGIVGGIAQTASQANLQSDTNVKETVFEFHFQRFGVD